MRLAPLFLALALPACSTGIAQLDPTPNVMLMRSSQTLDFSVGAGVPDALAVEVTGPGNGTPSSLKVTQWHQTLTNAFRNSIAGFFAPKKSSSDLTLRIVHADPSLERVGDGAFRAHVRFQAELVDHDGKTQKTWATTSVSRISSSMSDADVVVRSAIEAMYEEIANGMPVPASPPPSPTVVQ